MRSITFSHPSIIARRVVIVTYRWNDDFLRQCVGCLRGEIRKVLKFFGDANGAECLSYVIKLIFLDFVGV